MYSSERSYECVGINNPIPDGGLTKSSDVADSDLVMSPKPLTYAEAVRKSLIK